MRLIIESEQPKRQDVHVAELYVVFDYVCVFAALYLFLSFIAPAYFESMPVNQKVGYGRRNDIMVYPHLVQEKSFGLACAQCVNQVRIVQVYFVYFAQSPDTSGVVPQLGDESGFFYEKAIVRYAVPAYVQSSGYATDVRFERHAFGNNGQ